MYCVACETTQYMANFEPPSWDFVCLAPPVVHDLSLVDVKNIGSIVFLKEECTLTCFVSDGNQWWEM